jgi:phosphatidylinositol glycan class N
MYSVAGGAVIIVKQLVWNYVTDFERTRLQKLLFYLQLSMIALSTWIVQSTDASLAAKTGLPLLNQYLSIFITIVSVLLPLLSSNSHKIRLQSLFLGLASPLILLSVAYEVLFFASLDMFIYLWMKHEIKRREPNRQNEQLLTGQDFATAMFYIFLFNVGFFGTGNLATIASFELGSVYRFVTVFAPFVMTGLLLFKIITPLLGVTAAFGMLLRVTNTPQYGAFFIVLALYNVMTINFFFLVQTVGSWMDIGNSISRFAIGNAMIIVLLILFGISQAYSSVVIARRR